MIAFGIVDYTEKKSMADINYVKFYATYDTMVDGKQTQTPLEFEPCSSQDYAKFYPPNPYDVKEI